MYFSKTFHFSVSQGYPSPCYTSTYLGGVKQNSVQNKSQCKNLICNGFPFSSFFLSDNFPKRYLNIQKQLPIIGNYVQEIPEGVGTIAISPQPKFLDATEYKGGMPPFHALEIAHPQFARDNRTILHLRDEALKKASNFA